MGSAAETIAESGMAEVGVSEPRAETHRSGNTIKKLHGINELQ